MLSKTAGHLENLALHKKHMTSFPTAYSIFPKEPRQAKVRLDTKIEKVPGNQAVKSFFANDPNVRNFYPIKRKCTSLFLL